MISGLGQYLHRRSPLHLLDPRTKLFALAVFVAMVLVRSRPENHALALAILIAATRAAKIEISKPLRTLWAFRIFLAITFAVHLLFTPGRPGFDWGIFHVSVAGVGNGLLFSARMALLMWSAALFGWTTSPIALADALEKLFFFTKPLGLPPRDISTVVLLAMRFVPTMMDDATRIRWAQLARGGNVSGGLVKKVKGVIPMVVPLFVSAFRRADKLALALELRGYDSHAPRTKLYPVKLGRADWLALSATAILGGGAIYVFASL